MKANSVFTPGAFPNHTYVERTVDGLEQTVQDALATQGQVVSLSGPSKSGKTVLVEKVVGRDYLITVQGAGIRDPDDIWERVLDWIGASSTESKENKFLGSVGAEVGASGSSSLLGLMKAEGGVKGQADVGYEHAKESTYCRGGLAQVVKEIANSEFTVLVDDFHYMPRETQASAAKSLKEAVRLGVRICTAAVRHRGDDVVRANPELRGRVRAIDLQYWRDEELRRIATVGFATLQIQIEDEIIDTMLRESAGSPQLMQLLCLNTCFVMNARERMPSSKPVFISQEQLNRVLEQTSANTDFRSLVDVIDAGPKTRGTERKLYDFNDATKGDVYRCVLKAVASDPPRLSFHYDELTRRTAAICNAESPVGSSIVGTCLHMSRLALEKFPNERAIDWDEQKQIFDLPDPYLLFYLRWSGRLNED